MSDRSRRIRKIEDHRRPRVTVPHVVEQLQGETQAEAWARFQARYAGHVGPSHAVLFVPTWPTFDAFAANCKSQQTELLEWVKSHHPKEPTQ